MCMLGAKNVYHRTQREATWQCFHFFHKIQEVKMFFFKPHHHLWARCECLTLYQNQNIKLRNGGKISEKAETKANYFYPKDQLNYILEE